MNQCDVAIIGGGPGGSTVASFLRKFRPELDVVVFERETFPRDHIGESLLPRVTEILNDLGVWDEMEAAEFPIKVGAKYRWGDTENLWNFDFIPGGKFEDQPRPGKYEGQRKLTAWQVDRATYDKILLDHSRKLGAKVFEDTKVTKIHTDGDNITHLTVDDKEEWKARYYVDASGSSGLLRRTMGIEIDCPTELRNIAIWDYWRNADWAEHIGVGGTRIRVLSLGWGWIWFIPISPVRTSIGLVAPAAYVKASGKKPEELYREALASESDIQRLTANATREADVVQTTKDWNFISERLTGSNWFLVGDSAGFADPILSAGLSLTHSAGLRVANCIVELEKGELDSDWLKADYSDSQRAQIRNHMAFAEFWYFSSGKFADVIANCSKIAADAGLSLDPTQHSIG